MKNQGLVVITGASRGIGLGLLRHYLEQGRSVVAACRQPEQLAELSRSYANCQVLSLDLADEASIDCFAKDVTLLGAIDLLVNNAGTTIDQPFGQWTQAAFTESFCVNTVGPALLVQQLAPLFLKGAKVVQLSSGLASIATIATEQFCSYALAKTALNMLTAKLALLCPEQTVIAMSPGWVQTDMGGPEAPDTVEQLVPKFCSSLESLSKEHSGGFFDENGDALAF
ncbi:SDR family oxidoreductase [Agaribacterium sp. ZY112]|uniref:SDR family oxidoreductase n=1 Tax=Agaribacterium sp. ZY112 TaxID=3233574 RepID=UPI003525CE29